MPEIFAGMGSLTVSVSVGLAVALIAVNRFNNLAFWIVFILLVMGWGAILLSFFLARKRENREDDKFILLINEVKGLREDLRRDRNERRNNK